MRLQGLPSVKYNRSKFDLSHNYKTTFNVGDLVPLDCQEVLPGDSFKCKVTAVVRTSSPFIRPIMDNMYMDIHHFYVPLIQLFDDAEKIFGNPNPSSYVDDNLATAPTVNGVVSQHTVGDYFRLPLARFNSNEINVLPFRAFAKVYDEWFRNQNVVDEMYIQKGSTTDLEYFNNNPWSANNYLGKLPKVSKRKDYFTSLVPQPQKGEPVTLGLEGFAPVKFKTTNGNYLNEAELLLRPSNDSGYSQVGLTSGSNVNNPTSMYLTSFPSAEVNSGVFMRTYDNSTDSGLVAQVGQLNGFDLNDFRLMVATQRLQELDSMYGSRYNEILMAQFGVQGGDLRLHFTEYLGGGRIPISIQQVAQTSQGTESSPLAEVSGYSLSNGFSKFSKGFTEHGYIITVGCVKQKHSYSQGVPRYLMRTAREDYYTTLFANLGYQPIYESEIFYNHETEGIIKRLKGNVLGYNEAWADYRQGMDGITGQMRSNATDTLDIWHLGDFFENAPTLTSTFIEENTSNVDRVLSVPSESLDNFICDLWFDKKAIRVMPTYSTPSLEEYK